MNLALIGHGKMGQQVERCALERGHSIQMIANGQWDSASLKGVDLAIEFSRPEAAFENVTRCLRADVAVVCGTTGWNDKIPDAEKLCKELGGSFLFASNFSIGVNLLFALNKWLAERMNGQAGFAPELEEIHHEHKLDAPSGTAIRLAEDLIQAVDRIGQWKLGHATDGSILPIEAKREGEVPGTHRVTYRSATEELSLQHVAKDRVVFAEGAVLAAEWLMGQTGCFRMSDVLNFNPKGS